MGLIFHFLLLYLHYLLLYLLGADTRDAVPDEVQAGKDQPEQEGGDLQPRTSPGQRITNHPQIGATTTA